MINDLIILLLGFLIGTVHGYHIKNIEEAFYHIKGSLLERSKASPSVTMGITTKTTSRPDTHSTFGIADQKTPQQIDYEEQVELDNINHSRF